MTFNGRWEAVILSPRRSQSIRSIAWRSADCCVESVICVNENENNENGRARIKSRLDVFGGPAQIVSHRICGKIWMIWQYLEWTLELIRSTSLASQVNCNNPFCLKKPICTAEPYLSMRACAVSINHRSFLLLITPVNKHFATFLHSFSTPLSPNFFLFLSIPFNPLPKFYF